MDSTPWHKAQEILADALELPEEEREGYVQQACAGDEALAEEVRSLLKASGEADDYFDGFAEKVVEAADAELEELTGLVGRVLGHYEVRASLGEGGMGRVYRAFDTRLEREVALKVLPPGMAGDEDHVARFRREAQVVASLHHPHVAGIHGVEEFEGRVFLVLELVEGPTLAELLSRGPFPVQEALDVGRQVAEALEAAHDIGVVHRDLKPDNVKVAADGTVRVLDFGIAKRLERRREPGSYLDVSPSTPIEMTAPGAAIGTVTYMSPEQARAKPIDERSDIWSFGALLYELLTGVKAFQGEDRAMVLARILEAAPDWEKLPAGVPDSVRRLVHRCLEKQVRRRLQAIGEARITLEDALIGVSDAGGGRAGAGSPAGSRAAGRWSLVAIAGAALLVGYSLSRWLAPSDAADAMPRTLRLAVSEDADAPTLAPTGDRIVYSSDEGAWVVFLDGTAPRRLEGTTGSYGYFWSPGGEYVGFLREGSAWRVPVAGGAPTRLTPRGSAVFSGAWLDDGTVAVSHTDRVAVYPEGGGSSTVLWQAPAGERTPTGDLSPAPGGGVFMVRERTRIWHADADGAHEVHALSQGTAAGLSYAPQGYLLYYGSDGNPGIWALPVTRSAERSGEPILVSSVNAPPSVSRAGDLVYFDRRTSLQQRNLVWVNRTGQTVGVVGEPQARVEQIDVSPSGRRVVVAAEEGGRRRVWVYNTEGGDRFALSPMLDPGQRWPRWSPDEDKVVFRFDYQGDRYLGVKSLDPGTPPVPLSRGWYPSFAPDGRILFALDGDIYRIDPDAPDSAEVFLGSPLYENRPLPSSNGLVAYEAVVGAVGEIFVTRYDDPSESWQVSQDGGEAPKWREDGGELFFVQGDTLFSVAVEFDGGTPRIGRPSRLFDFRPSGPWGRDYDPNPDGDRFLMLRALPRFDIQEVDAIVLLQNWAATLGR